MSESAIHPTAIVSRDAKIGAGVEIGPGAVIEGNVRIGTNTSIGPYAIVHEYTRIGDNNRIGAHAVIGGEPQHTGYDGSDTYVVIGNDNVLREFVTVNRAYVPGAETRIGASCVLMTAAHVGHDTIIGDHVILTNNVLLGGHVEIANNVIMGGASAAHQFTRIGPYCMVAAFVALKKDALPFSLIGGTPVRHYRLNTVGLRRNGIKGDRYRALENAFDALKRGDRSLDGIADTEEVAILRDWLSKTSKYGRYGFASAKR